MAPSIANCAWLLPNPRMAPLVGLFVYTALDSTSTLGTRYAPHEWQAARSRHLPLVPAYPPASPTIRARTASRWPSASAPTRQFQASSDGASRDAASIASASAPFSLAVGANTRPAPSAPGSKVLLWLRKRRHWRPARSPHHQAADSEVWQFVVDRADRALALRMNLHALPLRNRQAGLRLEKSGIDRRASAKSDR